MRTSTEAGFCALRIIAGIGLLVYSLAGHAAALEGEWVLNEEFANPNQVGAVSDISTPSVEPTAQGDPANNAVAAAVADGVTTSLALSAGAVETNPLIATNPLGLVAVTGMKIGLVKYAETLPVEEKRLALKTSSAAWGGAAINNVMVLLAAPPPIPIIAGLFMGFATWFHMDSEYEKEDQLLAARNAKALAAADTAAPELAVANGNNTSGN